MRDRFGASSTATADVASQDSSASTLESDSSDAGRNEGATSPTGYDRREKETDLHIVYFRGDAQSRSLTLSSRQLGFFLAACAAVVVWVGVSLVGGLVVFSDWLDLRQEMVDTRKALYHYEVQHDGVFALAYPKGAQSPPVRVVVAESKSEEGRAPRKVEKTFPTPKELALQKLQVSVAGSAAGSSGNARKPAPESTSDVTASNRSADGESVAENKATDLETNTFSETIAVRKPRLKNLKDRLEVTVQIVNRTSPQQAKGYVWAIAEMVSASGEVSYLTFPKGFQQSDGNGQKARKRAHRFRIRNFAHKKIDFKIPDSVNGAIRSVKVHVMDDDGKGYHVENVPVDVRLKRGRISKLSLKKDAA